MNGAESLLTTLTNNGIEVCFTNPGTSEMHFVAALDEVGIVIPKAARAGDGDVEPLGPGANGGKLADGLADCFVRNNQRGQIKARDIKRFAWRHGCHDTAFTACKCGEH